MEYEIVTLEEKLVAGVSARTKNDAPDMQQVIGGLWGSFYGKGMNESLTGRVNEKAIGLYSDYASDESGEYDVTVGCEVTSKDQTQGICLKRIPQGKYAKFIVQGDMVKAVADFWGELWKMDLNRAYTADFEEYQDSDPEHGTIHMYISLK